MFVTNQAPLTPSVLGHTCPTPSHVYCLTLRTVIDNSWLWSIYPIFQKVVFNRNFENQNTGPLKLIIGNKKN